MPKLVVVVVVEVVSVLLLSNPAELVSNCLLSADLDEELGFGAVQQTHLVSDCLF